jgi:protein-tyrosine phosphatase
MVSESDALGYELRHADVSVLKHPMTPQSGVTPEQVLAGGADNLIEDYLRQVEVNADSIIATLQLMADPANRPVIIHCTAGKDRTGIVVAVLLSILGVDDDDIVADYHATTINMAPIVASIRAANVYRDNGLASAPQWIFDSEPETMRAFLSELEVRYGSAEGWALAKGLGAETIAALRESLLA